MTMGPATTELAQQQNGSDGRVRRLRTILPHSLYRRLAVQAAREEAAKNAVVVKAIEAYLAAAEGTP